VKIRFHIFLLLISFGGFIHLRELEIFSLQISMIIKKKKMGFYFWRTTKLFLLFLLNNIKKSENVLLHKRDK
jgi:hypothetical protein